MVTQIKNQKWFRWHDAGDIQSLEHLEKIFEVCKQTPETMHWMPTREAQFLKTIDPATVPKKFNNSYEFSHGGPGSCKILALDFHCNKHGRGNLPCSQSGRTMFKDCRACWTRSISNISYGKH